MTQPTQTMECTTEVPYISIYDKPKRRTLTREEKLERLRQNYKRYYYENPERESLRKKKEYARKKEEAKKYEYHKNMFFGFLCSMNSSKKQRVLVHFLIISLCQ